MRSALARFTLAAAITALAVLVLAVSWLAWRIGTVGPLALPWLVEPVERALVGDDESIRADVETVALAWPDRRGLPEIVVLGLVVSRQDGTEIGRLPELAVRPSGRALLGGRLAIGAVGLTGIRLAFLRGEDGRVSLGPATAADAGPATLSPALVRLLAGPPDPDSAIGWLRLVRIRSAEILLDDRVIDARWTLGAADVDLRRRAGSIEASVRARLALAMTGASVNVPLEASARTVLDASGAHAAVEFDALGTGGTVTLAGGKPVALRSVATEGRFGIADASVDLRSFALDTNAGEVAASATLSFADGRFAARTEGELRDVPADRVAFFWPAPVASGARRWVTQRLTDGVVPRATFAIRHEATTSFRLDIAFRGTSLDYLAPLRPLRNAAGHVLVTRERLEVRLDGAEAGALRVTRGTLDAPLGETPIPAVVVVEVAGPAADLVAFLDEEPIAVSSRFGIPAALEAEASARAELRFPLSDDLAAAALAVDASGTVTGEDVDATIETRVAGGGVEHLAITPLRWRGNRLSLEARAEPDGVYRVTLSGASGDLRPFVDRMFVGEAAAPTSSPDVRVAFDLERVLLGDGTAIVDAEGESRLVGGRIATLDARGTAPGGGAARLDVRETANGRAIALTSERAGELLGALGVLEHVRGGTLELRADVDDRTPPWRTVGQLDLRDFRVVRAPLLARILSLGSLDGIADLLGGDGLAFRQARMPFVWSERRLEISGATAIGAIGITADGLVDRGRQRLDLRGEVIPAYTLNSALGSVPILGSLLAGTDGKGVFGIEYRAKGGLAKPDVDTNALTALAPRRLREMFLDPFRGG